MSNDQHGPPGAHGRVPDYNTQFGRMNINANAFIPNAQAPAFIPGGHPQGYPPHYGGGFHQMSGPPMHMYGPPPGMQMGMPPHMMSHGGHYMMQQQQPPHHNQAMPPSHGKPPGNQKSSQSMPVSRPEADHQRQQQTPVTYTPQQKQQQLSNIPNKPQKTVELTTQQDTPVDSWEDIVDTDNSPQAPPKTSAVATPPDEKISESDKKRVSEEAKTDTPQKTVPKAQLAPTEAPTLDSGSGSSLSSNSSAKEKSNGRGNKSEGGGGSSLKQGASALQAAPKPKDDKENVNIIFIGHVDAGKSTIGGHVMYLTGQVDKRTLEKYEREAKEKNRETWYLSWALDTNQEERDKGKTVEVGRASFETEKKRFTILDAPGHAGFVPNMISGAAQADIGVLVISARKGEFETGFERKGQTREHAMLAKTAGVKHLVVLINKMDDSTVQWAEERYEECKTKLTPFLKKVGFNPKTDIFYIPVSGLTGVNLRDAASSEVCPWYSGPPFITYLNDLAPIVREDKGPFRMPISDKYKDMGTVVMGKVESGAIMKGATLLLMPNRASVEVLAVYRVEEEVQTAYSGDNIKLKVKGIEEEDISPGFVLCDPASPCHVGQKFEAQIAVLEHKSIICAGYSAVLHVHAVVEEVQITQLKALIDRKTGKKMAQKPRFVKQDQVVLATLQTSGVICLETFKEFPQMARFTLRDEGKTIAIGKVLKLIE